jgi:diguanylate cyclase (GGDEF)-like protein
MDDLAHLLDVLCPMHLVLDRTGHIAHVGPTLAKLRPAEVLAGQRFLEVFEMRRPRSVRDAGDLRHHAGARLHMRFRSGAPIGLKGVLMPAPGKSGGLVVNLSFGISVVEAVREFSLTGGDFAATDLTIEMLYLVEAKSAAMEASRKLNQKLEGAKIAAEEQAFTDTLTGLKNRRAMDHVLARLVAGPGRFALMHLDLDYFKAVNDSMGHAAGDHVLQEVAKILVEETRREDTVARVGGDEFMLLFVGKMNRRRLADISERLIARLERPITFGAEACRISGSIGITMSEDYEALDMAQLQEDADIALYASKNRGRACHTFYDPALRTGAFAISPEAPGGNVTLG